MGGVGTQRKSKNKNKLKETKQKAGEIQRKSKKRHCGLRSGEGSLQRRDWAVLARASRPGLGVGRRLSRSKLSANDPRAVLPGRVGRGRPLPRAQNKKNNIVSKHLKM